MKITIRKDRDTQRVDFTVNGKPYHTNNKGEGLWTGDDYMKQIEGTAQFNLKQKSYSGMRKVIERRYSEVEE